jgi:hypothetical protein
MANNSLNTVQVVVTNGQIFATHSFNEDLYDIYDHTLFAWFDYNPAGGNFETGHSISRTDTLVVADQTTGVVLATPTSQVSTGPVATADPRLTMTLPNCQAAVISMLNRILQHQILLAYPLQTQLDIIRQGAGYNSGNLTTMASTIDGLKAAIATKIAAVQALNTNAAVIAYNVFQ